MTIIYIYIIKVGIFLIMMIIFSIKNFDKYLTKFTKYMAQRELNKFKEQRYQMKDIKKYYLDEKNSNFWMIVDEDRLIACVGCEKKNEEVLELKGNSVLKQYRRMGLATRLCLKVEEFAKENGFKKIYLTTSTTYGYSFYQKLKYNNYNTTYIGYRPIFHFEKIL
jgi:N-acetylglutamate synthase-like GNAT family acetyltransferase